MFERMTRLEGIETFAVLARSYREVRFERMTRLEGIETFVSAEITLTIISSKE